MLGRATSVTPYGGDGDKCPDSEPDDQDGNVVPGVMAIGEPAYCVSAGCHRYRPPERGQQVPEGKLVRWHLRRTRDNGRGDEHAQKAPSGIQALAPFHHLLPTRLAPARALQQPPPPPATDGIAAKPTCLTSEDRHHDHRRQVQPPLAGGYRGGPK